MYNKDDDKVLDYYKAKLIEKDEDIKSYLYYENYYYMSMINRPSVRSQNLYERFKAKREKAEEEYDEILNDFRRWDNEESD